jgi:hypothetical protein
MFEFFQVVFVVISPVTSTIFFSDSSSSNWIPGIALLAEEEGTAAKKNKPAATQIIATLNNLPDLCIISSFTVFRFTILNNVHLSTTEKFRKEY